MIVSGQPVRSHLAAGWPGRIVCIGLWLAVALLAGRLLWFLDDVVSLPEQGFSTRYTAAVLLREGADVGRFYDDDWFGARVQEHVPGVFDVYSPNLPILAPMFLPFAALDYSGARLVWTLLNLGILVASVGWLLWKVGLAGVWAPAFIALVLLYQPLWVNFQFGQMYLILLGLLVLAWHAYRRRLDGTLGMALGLMLAIKLAEPLLWPLLLVQGRWRALASGAAATLTIVLVSLLTVGIEPWLAWIRSVFKVGASAELALAAYQSQIGLLRHLLVGDRLANPSPLLDWPALSVGLTGLAAAAMLGFSAYVARRSAASDTLFGAFVVLSLILSPVTQDYHYTLALLPIVLLIAWTRRQRSPWPWIVLGIAVLLVATDLPYRSQRLGGGLWALAAYPKLYGAWMLWGLSLWAGRPGQRQPSASAATRSQR